MPKIVDKDRKKEEISSKAMKIFVVKGFEKTTIQEIADGVGIGKGTIYEYFKTKEDIIAHSIMAFFQEMDNAFSEEFLAISDPREKLKRFIIDSVEIGLQDEDIWIVSSEIWYYNMRGGYESIRKLFNKFLNGYRGFLSDILNEGIAKGYFRDDIDSASIAAGIAGFMDGAGLHYLMDKESVDMKKAADEFQRVLLRGIEK